MKPASYIYLLAAVVMPKPFLTPLATLQKGKVHFKCYEPASVNGFGSTLMQFDLVLKEKITDPSSGGTVLVKYPLVLMNVQAGNKSGGGPRPVKDEYYDLDMDVTKNAGGLVMFDNTQYERIHLSAHEDRKMTDSYAGITEQQELNLTQDYKSKLVFVRYKRSVVEDKSLDGCDPFGGKPCLPRMRTPTDDVMLCEAQ